MRSVALVALERRSRIIPLCRTSSLDAVRTVAAAALAEIQAAADAGQHGEVLAVLLRQEADRLRKAFRVLGLAPNIGLDLEAGKGIRSSKANPGKPAR